MPQKLKDDVRERIVESAKEEFLEKGYENASMRRIAKNSEMTVGNLYRYFKNKEDINFQIVSPTLNKINDLVKKETNNAVDILSGSISISYTTDELRKMLDNLADEMVDIYLDRKKEFNILMMSSAVNGKIVKWFSDLLSEVIDSHYDLNDGYRHELGLLSQSFAIAIFHGLKELFRISDVEPRQLKSMVRTFLRAFVSMLDADIKEYSV